MSRKIAFALSALVLTFATGVTAAFAGPTRGSTDPGVTSTSILLGTTSPLSGVASAYASVARGADAYFKYVNGRGGVNGRKILDTIVDDAYNPALTVQATRQLVEQDKVFAVFNGLGTEQNLAVRDYLNAQKVPQLFAASGATAFGSETAKYPYTIGLQPSYQAEGWVLGKYLARTQGATKVAVLFQNDDYGADLLNGFKKGIERSRVRIAAAQPYEVTASDVQAQVAKLRSSGANVFAVFATPEVRDPGVRLREQARVEAEAVAHERRLVRVERHAARLGGWDEQGRRGLRVDRLPQGPDRPELEERRRDAVVPVDHEAVRAERERRRRLPRVRDGRGVDGGRGAP